MRYAQSFTHCATCRHTGAACSIGLRLLQAVARSVEVAGPAVGPDFALSGRMPVAGCAAPCVLSWRATPEACLLFGGAEVPPDEGVIWPGETGASLPGGPWPLARMQALGAGLQ
ncbi:hypothetical protein [Paragemmobacter ruber]|uniref:DUF1636 domain-containing protein n=1 Tax=Paragemmobacter ruber TaxID=1985673 RepID=A0ABW9Y738_9RHOB|nr:hypothetical protein [Rhodobacter ruber]NBE07901.1 hypothetical protein [Rhodobacter ruber]